MSVDFWGVDGRGRRVDGTVTRDECCMCSQGAPGWGSDFAAVDVSVLAGHADAGCQTCLGLGWYPQTMPALGCNMANANAATFLRVAGVASRVARSEVAALPIAAWQASIVRARAVLLAQPFEGATVDVGGVGSARAIRRDRSSEEWLEVVERFQGFVDAAWGAGAVAVAWG